MHVEPRLHGSRNEGLGLDGPIVCLHVSERKAHKATESGSDGSSRVQDVLIWIVSRHMWRTPVATLLWEGQAPLFLSVTSEWVRPALNATPWQLDAESFLHLSLVYCNYISKCFIAVETEKTHKCSVRIESRKACRSWWNISVTSTPGVLRGYFGFSKLT